MCTNVSKNLLCACHVPGRDGRGNSRDGPGTGYTAAMPFDVDAEVIANRPLSADYNVLALAAPAIAASTAPGQFVMVKANNSQDPLLRRPFSVFEILGNGADSITGLTIF